MTIEREIQTAHTNTTKNSVVKAVVVSTTCLLSSKLNKFNDLLPVIPSNSRTEKNRILYRQEILAQFKGQSGSVAGLTLTLRSDCADDELHIQGSASEDGKVSLCLESRVPGKRTLTGAMENVEMVPFVVELKEAWYESPFLITGYNVCEEDDFLGKLVNATGLNEKHKDDFLFSSSGVPMQGTGKTSQGKIIRLAHIGGGWHRNKKGYPDWVGKPDETKFTYADGVHGAYGTVVEGKSIAVDKNIIPKKCKVSIDGLGERDADDTGSAIKQYHIDVFLGSGKKVVENWLNDKINKTQRKVKFLGYEK